MKKCSYCGKEIFYYDNQNTDMQGFLFCENCIEYCVKIED